jgi:spore germination protein YaaH
MHQKKITLVVIFFVMLAVVAVFFLRTKNRKEEIINNVQQATAGVTRTENNKVPAEGENIFFVSGWLPYWAKAGGVASLQNHIGDFSEINIFAYSVDANGNLVDTSKIGSAPWPDLRSEAEKQNVKIIPTILWGDAQAMHKIFSDSNLLHKHIANIVTLLDQNNFSGVDIDYEGKDIVDRDNFSAFLKTLHEKLLSDKKTLNCTVEARTEDAPPAGFTGIRAMSWANDFSALNSYCDSVRVMAYDEVFQIYRSNTFKANDLAPAAPNADNRWVEQVMQYALKFIVPEKLILGVPTYGWEFQYQKIANGYQYARVKSVSYPDALAEARSAGVTPVRTDGGELSFTYQAGDGMHIVTFADAASVQDKINIAKKLELKGISLFKIDGLADPQIFKILAEIK